MGSSPTQHTTPIKDRPKAPLFWNIAFNSFFMLALLTLHGLQLIAAPMLLAPQTKHLFWVVQLHVERQFAVLLTFISRVSSCLVLAFIFDWTCSKYFGPTTLRITGEGDLALDKIVKRDSNGKVQNIVLPNRSVLIGNHQVYLDWVYLWIILYNASIHDALIIILKASLKWVPIVGPAMQLFGFIFLARKWEDDKLTLSAKLLAMASRAKAKANPLVLMIFPEGTLISRDTRPLSKKFADKMGIENMRHCLLPRSTGLLYCLRGLAKGMPDLQLIDATIAYDGIPRGGYGQDYYTLQSVFGAGVPPPRIHIHLQQYNVQQDVPIGDVYSEKGALGAADASTAEKEVFDKWIRGKWVEKDDRLERFYDEGRLIPADADYVDLDAAPRRDGDTLVLLGSMLLSMIAWRYAFAIVWRILGIILYIF